MSTSEAKKKKKTKVYSEAFPPNSSGSHEKFNPISDTHSLLSSIQIDPNKIYYKPLSQDNLIEIQNLHKEWFPIDYQKKFFETILTHQSSTYFLTIGAFYKVDDKEIILGSIMVEYQTLSEKFKSHTSDEILERLSKEISFTDEMNCTMSFCDYICAYIMTIGVVDECRRMHLGTTLIEKTIEKCLENNLCICLYLDVVVYNDMAIKFYRKNHFEEVTTIKNYYHVNGDLYDSKVYVRIFTKEEKKEFRRKHQSLVHKVFYEYLSFPVNCIFWLVSLNLCCKCIRKKHKLD